MRKEISFLQRRLQAPSEDAIEWRVAYEETKEALDKMMGDSDDVSKLEEKNAKLEETVDLLCAEKLDLEERVKELTESSSETRKEIEAIMNDVDKLEREMVCCQEQLRQREKDSKDFESRAVTAENRLQDLVASSAEAITEKEALMKQNLDLQNTLNEKSGMLSELIISVEQKSAEIRELKLLVQENEKEVQLTIEMLQKEQEESQTALGLKDNTINDLKACLTSKSEENVNLRQELDRTLSKVTSQREAIAELEDKINTVTETKYDELALIKKEFGQKERDLLEEIESMKRKVTDLSMEKDNIEARLSCAKQQAELTCEKLGNQETTIKEYEAELVRVTDEYRCTVQGLKRELFTVQEKLTKAEERIGLLSSKLSQVEANKATLLRETEEEKAQMAYNLGNEIDGLRAVLSRSKTEQEELHKKLFSSEERSTHLQESIDSLNKTIANKDDEIQALLEENKNLSNSNASNVEEVQHRLQSQIIMLETERDELYEEVFVINEELRVVANENMDLETLLKDSLVEVDRLKTNIDSVEKEKNNIMSTHEQKQDDLAKEVAYYKNLEMKLQAVVQKKETEIEGVKVQCSKFKDLLNNANVKNQQSVEELNSWKCLYEESKDILSVEKDTAEKSKMQYETKIHQCEEEISNLKDLCEKYREEIRDKHAQISDATKEKLSSLTDATSRLAHLEEKYASQLREKETELGELEMKLKSLECHCSTLQKQNKVVVSSEVDLQDKYNRLKDRYVLLEREKGNLEFEIDTMQADHDALGDQVRVLTDKMMKLEGDNKRLKSFIESMKSSDSQSGTSDIISSSGSTWNSDSRLSYDTLATNMDSLIDKMSSAKPEPVQAVEPIQEEEQDHRCVDDNPDDSFDESLFLPNDEDQQPVGVVSGKSADSSIKTNTERAQVAVYEEDKENTCKKSTVTFCATPSKGKDDYGNRRVPLSDRKNKTPLTNQSKRLRSSTKKVMSSSKKSRTNYLLIDNRQLFK